MYAFNEAGIISLLAMAVGIAAGIFANARHDWVSRFETVPARRLDQLFLAMAIGYVMVFGGLALTNQLALSNDHIDLAQYDQLVWNTMQGNILHNSFIPDAPNFLGKSFTLNLLAFVPLYAIWSDPLVLLLVQIVGLGLGGFPIYWFAREQVGRGLALAVGACYYLSPWLSFIHATDFHEIVLATPLLALGTYLVLHHRYKAFVGCLIATLLIKEEIAFVAIGFGIFIALVQRRRWLGLGVAVLSAAWGWFLLQYAIPYFHGTAPGDFYYFGSGTWAGERYTYLGKSVSEVIATIFTRPDIVIQHLLVPGKIDYVLHLLVPLLFIPLFGAELAALALPTFGYSILSDYAWQFSFPGAWYVAPLLPFLFFGTARGLGRIMTWRKESWVRTALLAGLVVAGGASYYFHAASPLARNFRPELYAVNAHTLTGIALAKTIPHDGVVVAQTQLLARLSQREYVHEIPRIEDYRLTDWLMVDLSNPWYQVHKPFWDYFLTSGYFETVAQQDGYIIARRKTPEHLLNLLFGEQITLVGYTHVATDTLRGGTTLRPIVTWQARDVILHDYKMLVQVEDPAGHVWAYVDTDPLDGHLPTTRWLPGKTIGDQYTLQLPPTMPAGDYALTLQIYNPKDIEEIVPVRDPQGRLLEHTITLDNLAIAKNKNSYTASQLSIEQPYQVDMGEMRLLGLANLRTSITPGEILPVGLYWRAREKPHGDYAVSVQLVDEKNVIAFEEINRPAQGTYSTLEWAAGEVLLDWHDLRLPQTISPGMYDINIVLKNLQTNLILGQVRASGVMILR